MGRVARAKPKQQRAEKREHIEKYNECVANAPGISSHPVWLRFRAIAKCATTSAARIGSSTGARRPQCSGCAEKISGISEALAGNRLFPGRDRLYPGGHKSYGRGDSLFQTSGGTQPDFRSGLLSSGRRLVAH